MSYNRQHETGNIEGPGASTLGNPEQLEFEDEHVQLENRLHHIKGNSKERAGPVQSQRRAIGKKIE